MYTFNYRTHLAPNLIDAPRRGGPLSIVTCGDPMRAEAQALVGILPADPLFRPLGYWEPCFSIRHGPSSPSPSYSATVSAAGVAAIEARRYVEALSHEALVTRSDLARRSLEHTDKLANAKRHATTRAALKAKLAKDHAA